MLNKTSCIDSLGSCCSGHALAGVLSGSAVKVGEGLSDDGTSSTLIAWSDSALGTRVLHSNNNSLTGKLLNLQWPRRCQCKCDCVTCKKCLCCLFRA